VVAANAACFLQGGELGIEAFVAFDRQDHPVGLCAEQGEPPGADLLGAALPAQDPVKAKAGFRWPEAGRAACTVQQLTAKLFLSRSFGRNTVDIEN
jgi:hypothetical protein